MVLMISAQSITLLTSLQYDEKIIFSPPIHPFPCIKGKPFGPITFLQDTSQIF